MKKVFFLSVWFLVTLNITAQDLNHDFDSFRKEVLSNYQEYRQGILDSYAKYLNGVWKEYDAFKGIKKNVLPKPTILPNVEEDNKPEPIKSPEVIPTIPKLKPSIDEPVSLPNKPILPPKPINPNHDATTPFSFYDISFNAPELSPHFLNSIDKSDISNVWDTYQKDQISEIADYLNKISCALGLNDWLQYELVRAYTKSICNSFNDRILLEHVLLSNLGYDVRLAKNGCDLALLISFDQQVYERRFLMINGTRYYVFEKDSSSAKTYSSCQIPADVYRGRPLELGFIRTNLNLTFGSKHLYQVSDGRLSVSGSINETVMKMIAHYPQCDISNYAKSNVLPPFHNEILKQLKPQLKGMSQYESVSALLHFMQYAFKYATDQQQHGYEKPYFIEENFYYPKNDCEDRAILFAFLVRNLVGLDVHLVQFPGHECTAVNFTDKTLYGDSYNYEGRRYLICDPTFIGASIGQCMPDFIHEQPKIEMW